MVVIEVGPEKIAYHVHKALLTHHSEYFRKALSGPWKEAEERRVQLDDVEPPVCKCWYTFSAKGNWIANHLEVNLFVHWLYTQQLPVTHATFQHITGVTISEKFDNDQALVLLKAYMLGERLIATDFWRSSNNRILELERLDFQPRNLLRIVEWAFTQIPDDRPILQYLVHRYCDITNPLFHCDEEDQDIGRFPKKFTTRILRRYGYMRQKTPGEAPCFAEHVPDKETTSCGLAHPRPYTFCTGYGFCGEPHLFVASG